MYPEAKMIMPMKIWKLPQNKEHMLSEVIESGKYFATEKIDGAFYQYEKTDNYAYLFGRTISLKTGFLTEKSDNVPHIIEAFSSLPPNTILIGEIYYPNKTSKDVVTIMGCLPEKAIERQKENLIHYYVHDILSYDGVSLINCGAYDRFKILTAVWELHNLNNYSFLRLAKEIKEDVISNLSNILKSGGEGIVLKKKDAYYTPDKRPAWSTIKCKQMDTVDLVCMGFCAPTKEYNGKEIETWNYWEDAKGNKLNGLYYGKGYIPITKPYYYNWVSAIKIGAYNLKGELEEIGTVSSGLTDGAKADLVADPFHYLYKVVELKCMSISKADHTLRHPVFLGFREDKSAKDCKISEIFC